MKQGGARPDGAETGLARVGVPLHALQPYGLYVPLPGPRAARQHSVCVYVCVDWGGVSRALLGLVPLGTVRSSPVRLGLDGPSPIHYAD